MCIYVVNVLYGFLFVPKISIACHQTLASVVWDETSNQPPSILSGKITIPTMLCLLYITNILVWNTSCDRDGQYWNLYCTNHPLKYRDYCKYHDIHLVGYNSAVKQKSQEAYGIILYLMSSNFDVFRVFALQFVWYGWYHNNDTVVLKILLWYQLPWHLTSWLHGNITQPSCV